VIVSAFPFANVPHVLAVLGLVQIADSAAIGPVRETGEHIPESTAVLEATSPPNAPDGRGQVLKQVPASPNPQRIVAE
jgi:hypothetical protein